jgi:hypothetical protein
LSSWLLPRSTRPRFPRLRRRVPQTRTLTPLAHAGRRCVANQLKQPTTRRIVAPTPLHSMSPSRCGRPPQGASTESEFWLCLIPRSMLSTTCWRRGAAVEPHYSPATAIREVRRLSSCLCGSRSLQRHRFHPRVVPSRTPPTLTSRCYPSHLREEAEHDPGVSPLMNPSLSPSLSCSASRIEIAMLAVQSPIAPLRRCVIGIKMSWSKLFANACDPYRPERHYMRGPGPKWLARHGAHQSSDPSKHGELRLSERQTEQSLLSAENRVRRSIGETGIRGNEAWQISLRASHRGP